MGLRRGARFALATFLILGLCTVITAPTRTSLATNGSGGTSTSANATAAIGGTTLRTTPTASGGSSSIVVATGGISGTASHAGGSRSGAPTLTPPAGVDAGAARPTWFESEVVLTVDPSYLAMPYAKQALEAALLAWSSKADQLPKVTLRYADAEMGTQTADENLHDHRIFFAPMSDKRAKGALAITLVTADENKNAILDADILVNGGHLFTDVAAAGGAKAASVSYDLQDVITHELGHWFGLDEDYTNGEATMYAYVYPGETKKRDLAQTDVVAVQLAYWQADNPSSNSGCSMARTNPLPADWGSGFWTIALGLYRRPNRRRVAHLFRQASRLHREK